MSEINKLRQALLQIGSQHPAWSSNPNDKLVDIFNQVTATARKAVGAVGAGDDAKADWCADQDATYPDEPAPKTLQQLAKEALDVQNACNLCAIVKSWSEALVRLRELGEYVGNDAENRHPVNVLFAGKVESLTGCNSSEAFSSAFYNAERIARGES